MCTVTYIPGPGGFYLTSNRDERRDRPGAIAPRSYQAADGALIYPKDRERGGSWIALRSDGVAAVLLNGAFLKHLSRPPYRCSRGIVFLKIVRANDPSDHFKNMDLDGIEPFTIVLVWTGRLFEFRWDGYRKHTSPLNAAEPHIWSSATLYDERVARNRKQWFEEWLHRARVINSGDVCSFHLSAGNGDVRNDLVMNRDNHLLTVSITSVVSVNGNSRMIYKDLVAGKEAVARFQPPYHDGRGDQTGGVNEGKKWLAKPGLRWRKFWTRVLHWEYWPINLVYAPVFPYLLWLGVRSRSFFFFNAANPKIENGGFTHERKSEIYRQLPEGYYPRTLLCAVGADSVELSAELDRSGMNFPLVAKPDIGERGTQVSLLHTREELENYCRRSRVNFLVQEYISCKMEAGIFYARMPGAARGQITGIVGKEFLSVTGDGQSTVRRLLEAMPRALLQIDALAAKYGDFLQTVLSEGVCYTLVPYGSHSRGAKFVDWSDRITEGLVDVIDGVCKQMPDFYFGRLDVKFYSWGDLLRGKFYIIEVNGAGSEPTHIYDPKHSIFFGWKEIVRHWRLLHRISMANAKRYQIPLMTTAQGLKMLRDHADHLKLMEPL